LGLGKSQVTKPQVPSQVASLLGQVSSLKLLQASRKQVASPK